MLDVGAAEGVAALGIGGLVGSACMNVDDTGSGGARRESPTVTHSDSVDDGSPVVSSTSGTEARKVAACDVPTAAGGPVPIDEGALDALVEAEP
eukprot:3417997-Amphidinium_carterae.1